MEYGSDVKHFFKCAGITALVIVGGLVISSVVSMLVFLFALGSDASRDVVAEVKSPTGLYKAVLEETNGGATTSFGYLVSVQSADGRSPSTEVAVLDAARRNDGAGGANLKWVDDHTLEVQYLDATWAKIEEQPKINGIPIVVKLRSGVRDPKAPAGGMVYNLREPPRPPPLQRDVRRCANIDKCVSIPPVTCSRWWAQALSSRSRSRRFSSTAPGPAARIRRWVTSTK